MNRHLTSLCCLALLPAFYMPSRAQAPAEKTALQITPAITRSLIDSLGRSLVSKYIFPDTAAHMAAFLQQQLGKGAYRDIKDPKELARRLQQDMQQAHHDGHLRLHYAPELAPRLTDNRPAEERRKDDSLQLAEARQANFFFTKAEILPGNVGYIKFNGFSGFVNDARPLVTATLRFVSNTRALIIDLRDNGGGSPEMVNQLSSYFFAERTHLNDIVDRLAGQTFYSYTDPARAEGLLLRMPVYILTAGRTFSAAEDFSYGLRSVKRALIVGDTTGGGAHPVRPFSVGHGFVAHIPFARSLNPYTHTDWEGTGVIPDIPTEAGQALDAALKDIFTKQSAQAKDPREKALLQWQLKKLAAQQSAPPLTPALLAQFTGEYQGGLHCYVEQQTLYCRNAERGNYLFRLQHIAGNLFRLDETTEIEFLQDTAGKVHGMNIHSSRGDVTFKPITGPGTAKHK